MNEAALLKTTLDHVRPKLPNQVTQLRYKLGVDSTGDEAIWVWVEMPDNAPDTVWSWESREKMRDTIRLAIEAAGLEPWVYVRFAESENGADHLADARSAA